MLLPYWLQDRSRGLMNHTSSRIHCAVLLYSYFLRIELNATVTYSCSHHSKNHRYFNLTYLCNARHVFKHLHFSVDSLLQYDMSLHFQHTQSSWEIYESSVNTWKYLKNLNFFCITSDVESIYFEITNNKNMIKSSLPILSFLYLHVQSYT